jgi:hypothetical protein
MILKVMMMTMKNMGDFEEVERGENPVGHFVESYVNSLFALDAFEGVLKNGKFWIHPSIPFVAKDLLVSPENFYLPSIFVWDPEKSFGIEVRCPNCKNGLGVKRHGNKQVDEACNHA